ncbi:hypothetical protein BpHYR1_051977 [Brachionus plicatilis]|uniref:Uncharacterized protein n=1 Tax=Brachionus plicatilis TaxID=10195 RepID=A0A3M7Q8D7_BRAPC|nr:hypothetical protein BpHYR1_051977 [Brachionus plicatilis]
MQNARQILDTSKIIISADNLVSSMFLVALLILVHVYPIDCTFNRINDMLNYIRRIFYQWQLLKDLRFIKLYFNMLSARMAESSKSVYFVERQTTVEKLLNWDKITIETSKTFK